MRVVLTDRYRRAQRLISARSEMRSVFLTGDMSNLELYDMVNFLVAQCSPEQDEAKQRLITIAQDLELDEPDADAFRFIAPATLPSRLERV